jgi:putative endopeptidase
MTRTAAGLLPIALITALSMHALAQTAAPPSAPRYGAWGVDLAAMDKTVKPGEDFDQYVNGGWKKKTEIPADQPSTGVGFDVFNRSQAQIRTLIEQAAPTTALGGMYRSFMDEAAVETRDDKPLQADLTRVRALSDKDAFAKFMAGTNGAFGSTIVSLGVGPDPVKPEINTIFIGQAGIGLPDRDYYLTPTFKPQLDAYRAYVERALTMTGDTAATKNAAAVMAFETELAKVSWAPSPGRSAA